VQYNPPKVNTGERRGEIKRRILLVLAVAILVVMAVQPALAITWGEPDGKRHPNVGAMVVDWPDYGPYQVCSGTLIHPRVFLTAGHCTVDWEPYGVTTFWVNFDEYALKKGKLVDVEQVIPHPDYYWGPTSDPHDVGALILKRPVRNVEPANLPAPYFLDELEAAGLLGQGSDKAKFTVVGYGGTLYWPPPEITYDDRRQFAVSEYRALMDAWLRLSQNQAAGDGGTCFGDSGGPVFWTDPDTGEEILVGITSWGDANCVSAAFNYRVDIPSTLDFIESVVELAGGW
jgi:hypothetical protein